MDHLVSKGSKSKCVICICNDDSFLKGVISTCWAFMIMSGIGQIVTAIISSGFACRTVCYRSSSSGRILYKPKDDREEIIGNNCET